MKDVFISALKLGLTSFGGPIAHLAYFREEYVVRRKWLSDSSYADLVALSQFLPGPASSQVGMGVGMMRAGIPGALAAWIGFTAPSAMVMALIAWGAAQLPAAAAPVIQVLMAVSAAIIIHALAGMWRSFAMTPRAAVVAMCSAAVMLFWSAPYAQVVIIAAGMIFGFFFLTRGKVEYAGHIGKSSSRVLAVTLLVLFGLLTVALPVIASLQPLREVQIFARMYAAGSMVFGGGHVVLPLIERMVVEPGWMSQEAFLTGYATAQTMPGPLFTISSYLGMHIGGIPVALLALAGIFLPSFLLIAGFLPFWNRIRSRVWLQNAMAGANAAVVGVLLAALFDPVWRHAVRGPADFAIVIASFWAIGFAKWPAWLVILLALAGGVLRALI
jgi:chromate transporter